MRIVPALSLSLSLALSLSLSLALILGLASRPARAETIGVDPQALWQHRLDRERGLYLVDEAARGRLSAVVVTVTIDETGMVTDAIASEGEAEYRAAARDLALTARFRPFTRDGRPVTVVAPLYIPILPPETPARELPLPEASPDETVMSLENTACHGTCPSYRLTVTGTGQVTFEGGRFVSFPGMVTESIDPALARHLIEQFRAARFFGLEDRYAAEISDGPSTILTLTRGGAAKQVADYYGSYVGMPQAVSTLQLSLIDVTRAERWIDGGPEIVPDLIAAGWDFHSPAAADMLACSLRGAPPALIAAYLRQRIGAKGQCDNEPAIAIAGERADIQIVAHLLAAGALEGADADLRGKAMIGAVLGGNPVVVQAILRHGGHAGATGPDGVGVLAWARERAAAVRDLHGDPAPWDRIVQILEAAGAN